VLLEQYKKYQDVFEKKNTDMLPQQSTSTIWPPIGLEKGAQSSFGPIYNLSQKELTTFKEYIDENLTKNFIRHLKSPTGAPILFIKKKDGSLWMRVDYQGLKKVTIKKRYPLPLIPRLLHQLGQGKIYTKIDLQGVNNLKRIWEGDNITKEIDPQRGCFALRVPLTAPLRGTCHSSSSMMNSG